MLSSNPNPTLGFGTTYFPPASPCSFHLSLIFSSLTPKMPALHKAAEIKAIYKCLGPEVPISEVVDTFLSRGPTRLPKLAWDLSVEVPLERRCNVDIL